MKFSEKPLSQYKPWPLWVLILFALAVTGGIWILALECETFSEFLGILVGGWGFLVLGALIILKRPENRIGWLAGVIGTQYILSSFLASYLTCGEAGLPLPGLPFVAWGNHIMPPLFIVTLFILLPQWFPNGRFLSPRWQTVTRVGISLFILSTLILGLLPGKLLYSPLGLPSDQINPFGLPFLPAAIIGTPLALIAGFTMLGLIFIAIASLIIRWRRSKGDERQQIKWFAYFLGTVVLVFVLLDAGQAFITPESVGIETVQVFQMFYNVMVTLTFGGFPIPIGIAVFKYRLYDIDLIIRRTLQYGILTGLLALIYYGLVITFQSLFASISNQQSPIFIVISTLAIAALFNPLRYRIQDFIDRRFYRRKYNAEQALAKFAATTRDEVDMEKLTEALLGVVEETMQPDHVSLWLASGDKRIKT